MPISGLLSGNGFRAVLGTLPASPKVVRFGTYVSKWKPKRRYPLITDRKSPRLYLSVTEESVSKPTELVQGTLDLLILKVVALEPMHGWAIAQRIHQMSKEVLQVGQGSLYPALHKLEQQGWIEAIWKPSENNRRAKYYSLTRAGRKALVAESALWERLSAAVSTIVRAEEL